MKNKNIGKGRFIRAALTALAAMLSSSAFALPYYYTDWTSANPGAGTAHGLITLPDSSTVTVDFSAVYGDGSAGSFVGAYTSANWTGWSAYSSDYLSAQVSTIPYPDMLQLQGGQSQIYKVHLGAAIKDPIMAIVSLGASGITTHYNFDSPFSILSQGYDGWGGCPTCLIQSGNDLIGNEGSGTIQFIGTRSQIFHGRFLSANIGTVLHLESGPPKHLSRPQLRQMCLSPPHSLFSAWACWGLAQA